VNYSVDPTVGPTVRTGTLTIGGQTLTVTEGGSTGPVINNITPVLPLGSQTITITGSGFGKLPAFTGDSVFIRVTDVTAGWNAGNATDSPQDGLTLVVASWSDPQIVVSGFGSQYGSPWKLRVGDLVTFQVWNPQSGSGPSNYFVTVGQPSATAPITAGSLTFRNPYANFVASGLAPSAVAISDAATAPLASSLSADGVSAVVAVYQSKSAAPVQFQLASASNSFLTAYDSNFLMNFNASGSTAVSVNSTCDASLNCIAAAVVWPAQSISLGGSESANGSIQAIPITITATQSGASAQGTLNLYPPPLLLVHGIWSSPAGAGFYGLDTNGFFAFILGKYPHAVIYPVDYSPENYLAFYDPSIQAEFDKSIGIAISAANRSGFAARKVDVFAHSMGGLVTRYWLNHRDPSTQYLPGVPIHKLITIGTPHQGTALATLLWADQTNTPQVPNCPLLIACIKFHAGTCSMGELLASMHRPVAGGVEAMQPTDTTLTSLPSSDVFSAMVGQAPLVSLTGTALDCLLGSYLPSVTFEGVFNFQPSDTIVPTSSQAAGAADLATIDGVVHTAIVQGDWDETHYPGVWNQALYWLIGGTGAESSNATNRSLQAMDSGTSPSAFDLTGYTQVDASNAVLAPASGSNLTISSPVNITATSSAKTITQLLLVQSVADPADVPSYLATQAPFSVSFTPGRLGAATFVAFVLYSDMTYSMTTLTYGLVPAGNPSGLLILDAPAVGLAQGTSVTVHTSAIYPGGPVDVTQTATYAVRSGSQSVFSVSGSGLITALGTGIDWLDVSYGGLTASAQIAVGSCGYTLQPANQLVPSTGGVATIPVNTASGCWWTAGGGDSWLTFSQASGTGSGTISLTASQNATADSRVAAVTLANQTVLVTQPASACSYSVNPNQINAPSSGQTGTFAITTSCPIVAVSSDSWVTLTVTGTSVSYTVAANTSNSSRSATLTIGTQSVPVTQSTGSILVVSSSHLGSFFPGEIGAAYLITVTTGGTGSTSGIVMIADTLPTGFTATAISGAGWNCTLATLTCTRGGVLAGTSYPLTVTVTVPSTLSGSVSNQVALSNGGVVLATAGDPTTILPFGPCDVNQNGIINVADVQLIIDEALGVAPAVNDLNGDGVVNVLDVQIEVNAALGLGCAAN
jgi:hypothetical protein